MSELGQPARGESAVRAVLASFVSPVRARQLAAEIDAAGGGLSEVTSWVRQRYGTSDDALVVALDAAGVPPGRIARLAGLDRTEVHELLDDEYAAVPAWATQPARSDRFAVARRVVWATWVVLAIVVAVAVVQERGGVLP